eukprot:s1184_g26.t1
MASTGSSELEQAYKLHVLEVPAGMEDIDGSTVSMALILLRRQSGMLLGVPLGVFADEVLAAGILADSGSPIGLSHHVSVAAGIKVDLADEVRPVLSEGDLVDVLLVDVSEEIVQHLSPFNPRVHLTEILHAFNPTEPAMMPMVQELTQAVWAWIRDPGSGELVAFYSAEEGDVVPETPRATLPPRRRATQPNGGESASLDDRPGPKKVRPTVATLAASLEQVTNTLPALVAQMEKLTERTENVEQQLRGEVSRPSALKTPLGVSAMHGLSPPSTTAAALAKEFPAPRGFASTGSLPSGPKPFAMQEAQQLEEEKEGEADAASLAKAMLVQSQALSALVQQLTTGDPIHDLSSTTGSLSSKGAQGRARLQQELASHKGVFFQSVIQSMSRRMQPARPADLSPAELALRGVTPTAYVERFGGYGRNKDIGCLQWQVALIMDHLQNDNYQAAKDGTALLAVCLEQAALDSGRYDIGLLLALADDPPAGVFQNRAATTYARGRAFAPMAEQRWVTTALSFIKEMDLIATKRQDAIGVKPDKDAATSSTTPAPKKTTKKTKGGAKGKGSGQQKEEEE